MVQALWQPSSIPDKSLFSKTRMETLMSNRLIQNLLILHGLTGHLDPPSEDFQSRQNKLFPYLWVLSKESVYFWISSLKACCHISFQHAFTACCCVFKEITLVCFIQSNYFENTNAWSNRMLKTRVATSL